jgi:hypothetical protein
LGRLSVAFGGVFVCCCGVLWSFCVKNGKKTKLIGLMGFNRYTKWIHSVLNYNGWRDDYNNTFSGDLIRKEK